MVWLDRMLVSFYRLSIVTMLLTQMRMQVVFAILGSRIPGFSAFQSRYVGITKNSLRLYFEC